MKWRQIPWLKLGSLPLTDAAVRPYAVRSVELLRSLETVQFLPQCGVGLAEFSYLEFESIEF